MSDTANRALIVYESMFGNSRLVADTVALGIGMHLPVSVVDAANAPARPGDQIGLLVIGSPTHALGLPKAATRQDAVRKFPERASARVDGVREWLADLRCDHPLKVAVFDTRVHTPVPLGSAARAITRRLRKLGFDVVSTESFYVTGTTGPLATGELSRARAWGEGIADREYVPLG